MTQADRVHSTPPINTSAINPSSPADTSRRGFLAQAAGVAAGGAALGAGLPLPAPAATPEGVPDPILAAIKAHKAARAGMIAAVHRHTLFERELVADKRLARATRLEDDEQREEEIEAAIDAAADVEREAACALLEAGPTTMAGVIALLSYAHVADTDGMGWPDDLYFNDKPLGTRSWHYFLIENLLEILPRFVLA
jgi:hypothetical protein